MIHMHTHTHTHTTKTHTHIHTHIINTHTQHLNTHTHTHAHTSLLKQFELLHIFNIKEKKNPIMSVKTHKDRHYHRPNVNRSFNQAVSQHLQSSIN